MEILEQEFWECITGCPCVVQVLQHGGIYIFDYVYHHFLKDIILLDTFFISFIKPFL